MDNRRRRTPTEGPLRRLVSRVVDRVAPVMDEPPSRLDVMDGVTRRPRSREGADEERDHRLPTAGESEAS
jgi:hypothetical protein